jgi:hypothetical protein
VVHHFIERLVMQEIQVPVWVKDGGMMINRQYLSPEHPDSYFNYIKNELGLDPEDYGYYCTQLSEEQKKLLRSIPDDALFRELRLRERIFEQQEMYG